MLMGRCAGSLWVIVAQVMGRAFYMRHVSGIDAIGSIDNVSLLRDK